MLYGGAIVVLACLLMVSVFTQGFGLVKAQPPACPVCNSTQPAQPAQPTQPTQPTTPALTVGVGKLPMLGKASAPVTIVQFSDFQCPYCAKLYTGAETQVRTAYVDTGKVKMYFRDFPLGFHPNAMPAAIAASCAAEQGKFWEMHDKLFANQATWSGLPEANATFKAYANDIGLNSAAFAACYDTQKPQAAIAADEAEGQGYGVGGTPASFIIVPKSKISGTAMKAAVDALIAQYGAGTLTLYENANEYTVLIPGAFPYETFDGILSKVTY
jgi:protein-disulfide isomerase